MTPGRSALAMLALAGVAAIGLALMAIGVNLRC